MAQTVATRAAPLDPKTTAATPHSCQQAPREEEKVAGVQASVAAIPDPAGEMIAGASVAVSTLSATGVPEWLAVDGVDGVNRVERGEAVACGAVAIVDTLLAAARAAGDVTTMAVVDPGTMSPSPSLLIFQTAAAEGEVEESGTMQAGTGA